MATERLKTPMLFPCAARVKVPQLGSEDSDLKGPLKTSRYAPASIVFRSVQASEPVSKNYLTKISTDLTFEEAVVRERCFHALPYDEKYLEEAFDLTGIVSPSPRTTFPVGRHNARGGDVRHMPCNLTKSMKPHLKPLKRKIMERAQQMHLEALMREELIEKRKQEREEKAAVKFKERHEPKERTEKKFFMTETEEEEKEEEISKEKEKEEEKQKQATEEGSSYQIDELLEQRGNHWDAYLMSLLSTSTANWIVHKKTPVGSKDHEKLRQLLKTWYGEPEHTDLVRDETSDTEIEPEEQEKKPKKKWKKKEATLLEKVYQLEEAPGESLDPYSDDNKAPFYRQPAGLRRARKHEEKEELGAINTTAANIEVKTYQPSPPPTLRDSMNPQIGDKLFDTDNMFQQEQLTGTQQVYEAFGDETKIQMETHNKYKKKLQSQYPKQPEQWYPETEEETTIRKKDRKKRRKFERGHKRWQDLPKPIDDTAEVLKVLPPGYDSEFHKSADPRTRKTAKSNASLMQITPGAGSLYGGHDSPDLTDKLAKLRKDKMAGNVCATNPKLIFDEWRTKWHLTGQYADSNPDDLIKDMADIQPHVRLKAIATCGKASDYKPPEDQGIQLEYQEKQKEEETLPEKLFLALECLLDDPVDKVRKAAAITLYSLSRVSEKATDILYDALQSMNPVDRWAAAQCLAHFGICDSDVVGEILKQVMNTEDTIKHERGISMLGTLSITSVSVNRLGLVHSMVAEQLNSSSWRHKIIACKILPTLKGDINKDITNKLSDLMWNDWHSEVRRAAAQCLGKTGHGREVHDDLRERILSGDEKIKLEAINKVGQLGIMTAKLLPAFLKCFEDEYVSVRSEVCITCGNLHIQDDGVIKKLVHLATFDTIWKVKALAFQALGKIGVVTDELVDCLLWAVRYEEKPGVRAEACHTLKELGVRMGEVAEVLQDRFLVESSQLVRDEIASALKMFDISATEDMDMVAQIKKEVRKLCTRNIIAGQITLNEQDSDRRENLARMIYESEKELQEHEKTQEPVMERLRSMSQMGSRGSQSGLKPIPEGSMQSTPEPGREGIVFTPTADQELEAIFNKEEVISGVTSPAGSTSTPGTKSAATSATLHDEEEGEEVDEGERKKKEGEDEEKKETPGSQTPKDTEDGDEEGKKVTDGVSPEDEEAREKARTEERPTSTVTFAAHLEVADIPSRSRSPLVSSRISMVDDDNKTSRRSSFGANDDRNMVFSRDAMAEREKINIEARNTFAVMDERYKDMVNDLIDLDNTFELGLTSGTRADFEKTIQNVRIVKTPPRQPHELPKIELTVDEVIDVQDDEEEERIQDGADQSQVETCDSGSKIMKPDGLESQLHQEISETYEVKGKMTSAEVGTVPQTGQEMDGNQSPVKTDMSGSQLVTEVAKTDEGLSSK